MLSLILLLPVLVVLVAFGLSNREEVQLHLWPFDLAWAVPLSTAMLVFAAVFFFLGALVAWAAGLRYRAQARRSARAAQVLEAELNEYRAAAARQIGPVPQPAGTSLARLQRPAA